MPAYRAEKTLARCHAAIPYDIVDEVLLVDDASDDATIAVAERLGITVSRHADNRGYGALETLPLNANADGFVFDNQILVQASAFGFRVGEISCPAKYFAEASSISLGRAIVYGLGVLWTSLQYRAWRLGIARPTIFATEPRLRVRPQTRDSTVR